MPATCPKTCPQLDGVPRADAERAGILLMELLERLSYGSIEITVSNRKITRIQQCHAYRLEELEATFAPEMG
jgi:hypothetical protein